ncbi:MAG: penicillin-binding protein, partial [Clostridia bacterium]|nr:penicillin-binding protein [Clostridia bacterium]
LDMNRYATADDCMAAFKERFDLTDSKYTEDEIRDIISVRYNMEFKGYSNSTPYRFAENISRDIIAIVLENSQGFPGVECASSFTRYYKNGALIPHIIGTVGAISRDEYEVMKDKGYTLEDTIGKSGIEAAFEERLRGTAGEKRVTKTSDGAIVDEVETVKAVPGDSIYLTIDTKLQEATNKALAENVKAAGKMYSDCVAGAAVMLDLRDFSVLACSTYPTFDLQKYFDDEKYYASLVNDDTLPLFDRALTGNFIVGSTFKPCVAAAALEEGVVNSGSTIYCSQNYDYYKTDIIKCLGYHKDQNVVNALANSCNYYFAEVGRQLGIESMDFYAEKFGLGVSTGIELYESRGILAGRDSEMWYEGNTCQAAIGQSDNAFTPIQLATYVATVANDGVRLRTHFVDKITDNTGEHILLDNSEYPEVVETVGVSTENMRTVKEGMRKVVTSGTAKDIFAKYKVNIAAKTGTAENIGTDNVTFIAFAPYENPQVALAVVIEHGGKGTYSMNTAKAMLDAYFANKK